MFQGKSLLRASLLGLALLCGSAATSNAATLTWGNGSTLVTGKSHVQALTCANTNLCTAYVSTGAHVTAVSFNPVAPAKRSRVALGSASSSEATCPSATLCLVPVAAGGQSATALEAFNPAATTAPTVIRPFLTPTSIDAVACDGVDECVVAGFAGTTATLVAVDPSTGSVMAGPLSYPSTDPPRFLACPIATQCTEALTSGGVATFDPTALSSANPPTVDALGNGAKGLTCLGAGQCFEFTSDSTAIAFTPYDLASAFSSLVPRRLSEPVCPTATFCVAPDGTNVVSGSPQSQIHWGAAAVPTYQSRLTSVACASANVCLASDGTDLFTGTQLKPTARTKTTSIAATATGVNLTVRCSGTAGTRCALNFKLTIGRLKLRAVEENLDLDPGTHAIRLKLVTAAQKILDARSSVTAALTITQLVPVRSVQLVRFTFKLRSAK